MAEQIMSEVQGQLSGASEPEASLTEVHWSLSGSRPQAQEPQTSEFAPSGLRSELSLQIPVGYCAKLTEQTEGKLAWTPSSETSAPALHKALLKSHDDWRQREVDAFERLALSIQRQLEEHQQGVERQRALQHERTLKLLELDEVPRERRQPEHLSPTNLGNSPKRHEKVAQVTFLEVSPEASYPMIHEPNRDSGGSGGISNPVPSANFYHSSEQSKAAKRDTTSTAVSRSRYMSRTESTRSVTLMSKFVSLTRIEDRKATVSSAYLNLQAIRKSRTWGISLDSFCARHWRPHVLCFDPFRRLVAHRVFDCVVVGLIVLNALLVALAADAGLWTAIGYEEPWRIAIGRDTERLLNIVFVAFFTMELLLRLLAKELSLWFGPVRNWNILDLIIVAVSILDIFLTSSGMSWIRLLRLLRVVRTLRIIRVFRFFRQLRVILVSVCSSMVPLFWAFIFIFLTMFAFSMLFFEGITEYISKVPMDDEHAVKMQLWFNGLPMALLSHFLAVSGGWSWWDIAHPLFAAGSGYGCVFIFYVMVMLLMILNIITGIFVSDAIETAHSDREFAAEVEIEKSMAAFDELLRLFEDLDTRGSGSLSQEEFEDHAANPEVRAIFATLGLDISSPVRFFRLLDVDGSGCIEIDEFVVGCLNLEGGAKAVTMENILLETKRMMRHILKMHKNMEARIESLSSSESLASMSGINSLTKPVAV